MLYFKGRRDGFISAHVDYLVLTDYGVSEKISPANHWHFRYRCIELGRG
jgi:hypothetical protein